MLIYQTDAFSTLIYLRSTNLSKRESVAYYNSIIGLTIRIMFLLPVAIVKRCLL